MYCNVWLVNGSSQGGHTLDINSTSWSSIIRCKDNERNVHFFLPRVSSFFFSVRTQHPSSNPPFCLPSLGGGVCQAAKSSVLFRHATQAFYQADSQFQLASLSLSVSFSVLSTAQSSAGKSIGGSRCTKVIP